LTVLRRLCPAGVGVAVLFTGVAGVHASAHASTLTLGVDAPDLEAAIERAHDGDVIEVPPGIWSGQVVVDKAITVRGIGGSLHGGGTGRVISITAPGAIVEGLNIEHSGDDLSKTDACVYVTKQATGAIIRDNDISHCAFGIWIHETPDAVITANRVVGSTTGHRSNRGNGIHLFNADGLHVSKNRVSGGRDGIYVSATENSVIEQNRTTGTRYGIHYMFSYSNTVTNNVSTANGSGMAIMSSHHLVVNHNRAEENEEHGILFRDVQYSEILENDLLRNAEGLFFYSSTENTIASNRILHNDVGAKIWAGSVRNRVTENVFIGNRQQIFYVSTEDLIWNEAKRGNFWGDYMGWDQNGDGIGDRPYRVDSFTANLVHNYPSAALLLRSPSLELLSHLQEQLPMLKVPTVIDEHPVMQRELGARE
jgi:nitrous oxidase accessory protein